MKKTIFCLSVMTLLLLSGCTPSGVKEGLETIEGFQINKQYTQALNIVNQLLVTYPSNKELIEKEAELLIQTEQYDAYLQLRPSLTPSQQQQAERSYLIALIRSGHTREALERITLSLTKKETSDLYQLKGQALAVLGNNEEAEESYDKALSLDANNEDALINKAILLADSGRLYESLALLDQGIALHPDDYLLWYNKGTVLSDLGYQQRNVAGTGSFSYYSDALRHFEKSYRLNQQYQNTVIWLGITYLDLNQYKKAHQALETALSTDPSAYDAWYYQAKTFAAEKKYDEAKKTYKHLLEINPAYELAEQELILLENQEKNNILGTDE